MTPATGDEAGDRDITDKNRCTALRIAGWLRHR
jgi:hypothetical protein